MLDHPKKNKCMVGTTENFVASETWFPATILENMPESVLVIDNKGLITYCNKEVVQLFGYTADEVVGKNIVSLFAPDPNIAHLTQCLAIEDRNALIGQWRGKHKDGTLLWIDIKAMAIQDTQGNPMGFICVLQDIAQRKCIEEAFHESEERFRLMADTAPVMIWMSDITSSCTYFNKGWLDFTQRTIEQEYGNGWLEGVHPDDSEHCFTVYTTHFNKREPFRLEYRLRRFDGKYRWVLDHGVPRFTPSGIFAGYIGSCIDITELKEAAEQLQQSEERYRLVVENSSDLFLLCNAQGTKVYVSPSFTSILGYTMDEVFQMPALTLIHPDDLPLAQTLMADVANGEVRRAIYRYHHKDGQWLIFETRGTPIFDQEGPPSLLVFTAHDLTERVELEQRKDEFISMASHELKTPVTSIKAFTQVLANRSKKRGDEETLRFLIRMEVQLNNLIRLIGDLLNLTRIQTGKLFLHKEMFALDQLVIETIKCLQEATQTHQLLLEQCIAIQVYGDRGKIMQVLFNLLSNAIKYSPHANKVLLRVEKEEDRAVVSVQDFGIGIAQDEQTKIFEQFCQAPNDRENLSRFRYWLTHLM